MTGTSSPIVVHDPWQTLKRFTNARIALGRAGMSLPTRAHLDFQLAHAQARDAVALPLNFQELAEKLNRRKIPSIRLQSRAPDRQTYLQRPDLGRLLDTPSEKRLADAACPNHPPDIALVIADGLSSKAIDGHAVHFADLLVSALEKRRFRCSPVCLVKEGRVAVGDHIGEILSSRMTVVLIGERPGLSSPDSMGIYFTYGPKREKTDADRNCISNIHARGLSYDIALEKLLFLIAQANRLKLSGIRLKDDTPAHHPLGQQKKGTNFLLA
ncbi:MAG: ethanolamine ammonia-lyase subunit EutC [Desulfobacterales bacterium]|nr:ethanolamine ammonia-lyase subunit EutC [Desulfobacterales bacterium]